MDEIYEICDAAFNAEAAVAGSLLLEPETVNRIRGIVSEQDFLSVEARAVFKATVTIIAAGKPCDPLLVQAEAENMGTPVSDEYCRNAMVGTPTAANIEEYAKLVHLAAIDRASRDVGLRLCSGEMNPLEALAKLQEIQRNQHGSVLTPDEAAQLVMDHIASAASCAVKPFIKTGFLDLDDLLCGGLVAGGMVTLAARPGTGKTTVALCIAENVAAQGGSVLYISLEMTLEQIWACRIANTTGLSRSDVYKGNIRQEDRESWNRVIGAMETLRKRPFVIRAIPSSVEDIEREARCIDNLDLIVVDHLGLIKNFGHKTRYETMTETSHAIKQLALSLNVPILSLCQLNRASVQRENKRPSMADLRDSGAIEEDSDVVMLLFREAEYEDTKLEPWETQRLDVILDKNRHGCTGYAKLGFCGAYSRISDW